MSNRETVTESRVKGGNGKPQHKDRRIKQGRAYYDKILMV